MSTGIPTPSVPFSNGTEQEAWISTWCNYCVHDHGMHTEPENGSCDTLLFGALLAGTAEWRWPEAWLPEPDDGRFALPSRMTCALFEPCHDGDCTGDPGATERAERVVEVTAYWQRQRVSS